MKDGYDIFGGLPDTIEDDCIESVERLEAMMDEYIHPRRKTRDAFELPYQWTIDPDRDRDRWELCCQVLARRDVVEQLGPVARQPRRWRFANRGRIATEATVCDWTARLRV